MSRRSSRLMSGGYYNSDEESDSSSVTNISYRENPVKVFKKKAGPRKARSRTPTRANSNGRSASPAPPVTQVAPPSDSHKQPTMRTVACVSNVATPRPALTPLSTRCPSVPPEKSPYAGLCSSTSPGSHLRPSHKELSQSGVESSGYSSSEGPLRKPTAAPSGSTSRAHGSSGSPSAGYRGRISSALFTLMDSISSMAIPVRSKVMHVAALAKTPVSSHMKKACSLLFILLIILLCIWFLLPLLTPVFSRMTAIKTPSKTQPQSQPAIPATPPPQLSATHPPPVVDPAVLNAAVEVKMKRVTEAMQLKQEQLLSQLKERVQLDMQNMKTRLEAVESNSRLRLERELASLGKQVSDYQTDSLSAAASLSLKIQDLEAQNAKLSEEWSSTLLRPPPAPCPDTTVNQVHNHLTPELQQAMEKWFTDRIKEQDAVRLADKGSCLACGRPMADKMADFALETQGASVISTRCSETYRIRSACVTLFGFPLWYPSESPRTVIQGSPVLLPGKCWAFHGVQGTLVISLSHPITITHVTLDHLPRYNSPTGRIDSAPKDFEVYGMKNDTEEGTLLGTFTYDENGESTQTFKLPNPSDVVYRFVELHVLTNWGHVEYTCLYRFRVHGQLASK